MNQTGPFEIRWSEDGEEVITTYSGLVTYAELAASFGERIRDEERFRGLKVMISDFTGVDLREVTVEDVRNDAVWTEGAAKANPELIYVGIMPDDHLFGMGRMWMAYSEALPWKTFIVRSWAECRSVLAAEGR